jgi:UDP-N-acetylglucosamine 2-epimerase (non-hydrolysing)
LIAEFHRMKGMKGFSIAVVAGARPNFMKIAPIVRALRERAGIAHESGVDLRVSIVHTGQHYDENMSMVFFRELEIPEPDRYLGVGSGSHAEQTAKIMVAFEKYLLQERPDWVVVVGDVNSTIGCALPAKKLGSKVAHVEAGLRSFDMSMPEEINRKLTDAISDLFFVTEESGERNLRAEGVAPDKVFVVGNVMIDTLLRNKAKIEEPDFVPSPDVKAFCDKSRRYGVLTLHRPSNVDNRETLVPIWGVLSGIARRIPLLFPIHPRTRAKIREFGLGENGITLVDPVGSLDMLHAMKGAALVLTDSGGLQEETTTLGIPCITIRENTERPVTVTMGTNYLTGTDPAMILSAVNEILSGNAKKGSIPPLWDGRAAERIAGILLRTEYQRIRGAN